MAPASLKALLEDQAVARLDTEIAVLRSLFEEAKSRRSAKRRNDQAYKETVEELEAQVELTGANLKEVEQKKNAIRFPDAKESRVFSDGRDSSPLSDLDEAQASAGKRKRGRPPKKNEGMDVDDPKIGPPPTRRSTRDKSGGTKVDGPGASTRTGKGKKSAPRVPPEGGKGTRQGPQDSQKSAVKKAKGPIPHATSPGPPSPPKQGGALTERKAAPPRTAASTANKTTDAGKQKAPPPQTPGNPQKEGDDSGKQKAPPPQTPENPQKEGNDSGAASHHPHQKTAQSKGADSGVAAADSAIPANASKQKAPPPQTPGNPQKERGDSGAASNHPHQETPQSKGGNSGVAAADQVRALNKVEDEEGNMVLIDKRIAGELEVTLKKHVTGKGGKDSRRDKDEDSGQGDNHLRYLWANGDGKKDRKTYRDALEARGRSAIDAYLQSGKEVSPEVRRNFRAVPEYLADAVYYSRSLLRSMLMSRKGNLMCLFHQGPRRKDTATDHDTPERITGVPFNREVNTKKGEALKELEKGALNCGCKEDDALWELIFWKSTVLDASGKRQEPLDVNDILTPRQRLGMIKWMKTMSFLKLDDLWEYEEGAPGRPMMRRPEDFTASRQASSARRYWKGLVKVREMREATKKKELELERMRTTRGSRYVDVSDQEGEDEDTGCDQESEDQETGNDRDGGRKRVKGSKGEGSSKRKRDSKMSRGEGSRKKSRIEDRDMRDSANRGTKGKRHEEGEELESEVEDNSGDENSEVSE